MIHKTIIKSVGMREYQETWLKMREFTINRDSSTPDEIWLLEHPPVFTQGMSGKAEHVLDARDIPIVQTDRGGQVTYHGPGQLVAYLLFDLRRLKLGIKDYVPVIENSVIQLLSKYNIEASTKKDAPGVFVEDKKICSIGLKVLRGCTYHGIALNVNNDLEPFTRINPCGFQNLTMTKIEDFVNTTLDEAGTRFCEIIVKNLPWPRQPEAIE